MSSSFLMTNIDGQLLRQIRRNLKMKPKFYCFATAYFDFRILKEYIQTLSFSIENGIKVKFLISQAVSQVEFEKISDAIDGKIEDFMQKLENNNFTQEEKLFLYKSIKDGNIAFKIGFQLNKGIMHSKLGYIEFENHIFEWHGSMNHTYNGMMSINTEQVYYENTDSSRVKVEFEKIWENKHPNIITLDANDVMITEMGTDNPGIDKDEFVKWMLKRWNYCFFKHENTIYIKSDVKIPYNLPVNGAEWNRLDDDTFYADNFSEYPITRFIEENDKKRLGYFIPSSTRDYFASNLDEMLKFADLGRKIKNGEFYEDKEWEEFKKHFATLKRTPFKEQEKQAYFAYRMKKSLNFSVPGTGKTFVSLMTYNALANSGEVKGLFIIGPTSSHETWIDEFEESLGYKPKVLNLSNLRVSSDEKYRIISELNKWNDYDLIIGHFATISKYWKELRCLQDDMILIIDEVHYAKNVSGEWGLNISRLGAKFKRCILLTGTPAPNGEKDIHNLLRIAYGEPFLNYFNNSKDKERLVSNLHMRITFDDLGMQYKQIDELHKYKLTKDQIEEMKETYEYSDAFVALQLIPQTLSGVRSERFLTIDNSPKLEKLIKMIGPSKNTLIWNVYKRSGESLLREIKSAFPNKNVFLYNGSKSSDERVEIINDYKKNGGILIANPQTLAESVSLHMHTDETIYFEFNFNLVHWLQSKNRTFRAGMKNDMVYKILVAENNPFEEYVLNKLQEKAKYQINLIENEGDQGDFEQDIINFLEGMWY